MDNPILGLTAKAFYLIEANKMGIDPHIAALAFDGDEKAKAKIRQAQEQYLTNQQR
jgi:hypothetical protein